MTIIIMIIGALMIALGVDWLRDPEKAYKIDWLHRLLFPNSDPSRVYFILVRIFAGWLALMGALLIIGQLIS